MGQSSRERRQTQIEAAALALLEEEGYSGATMQAVARRAGASMETLYNWYGDKLGLYRSLVARNASEVKDVLDRCIQRNDDPLAVIGDVGPRLLALLTGEAAIALNRAAASDTSGELGRAIASAGRETIAPLIERVFVGARERRQLEFQDAREITEIYLGLLVADHQIRRVIGQLRPLTKAACADRSRRALALLEKLYAPARQ